MFVLNNRAIITVHSNLCYFENRINIFNINKRSEHVLYRLNNFTKFLLKIIQSSTQTSQRRQFSIYFYVRDIIIVSRM